MTENVELSETALDHLRTDLRDELAKTDWTEAADALKKFARRIDTVAFGRLMRNDPLLALAELHEAIKRLPHPDYMVSVRTYINGDHTLSMVAAARHDTKRPYWANGTPGAKGSVLHRVNCTSLRFDRHQVFDSRSWNGPGWAYEHTRMTPDEAQAFLDARPDIDRRCPMCNPLESE